MSAAALIPLISSVGAPILGALAKKIFHKKGTGMMGGMVETAGTRRRYKIRKGKGAMMGGKRMKRMKGKGKLKNAAKKILNVGKHAFRIGKKAYELSQNPRVKNFLKEGIDTYKSLGKGRRSKMPLRGCGLLGLKQTNSAGPLP